MKTRCVEPSGVDGYKSTQRSLDLAIKCILVFFLFGTCWRAYDCSLYFIFMFCFYIFVECTILFLCDCSLHIILLFVTQVAIQHIDFFMVGLRGFFEDIKDPFRRGVWRNIYRRK